MAQHKKVKAGGNKKRRNRKKKSNKNRRLSEPMPANNDILAVIQNARSGLKKATQRQRRRSSTGTPATMVENRAE